MDVVIDSVSIHHFSRPRPPHPPPVTRLEPHLRRQAVQIVLDASGGLQSEWCATCGPEWIETLIVHWESLNAIRLVEAANSLPRATARRLRARGFRDSIDKLILRIAIRTEDRTVVSNDGDFWDPARAAAKGNRAAPVFILCRDELGVTVWLPDELIRSLDAQNRRGRRR